MRKREIEKAKSALKYGSKCADNYDDWQLILITEIMWLLCVLLGLECFGVLLKIYFTILLHDVCKQHAMDR